MHLKLKMDKINLPVIMSIKEFHETDSCIESTETLVNVHTKASFSKQFCDVIWAPTIM